MTEPTRVFVFGANSRGIHGKGSALEAVKNHGAKYGIGVGHVGNSYAIPTKDEKLAVLPLNVIEGHIKTFVQYAKDHPELVFDVVKVGCGLAGYHEHVIAPFFKGAPKNCVLPPGWRGFNGEDG